MFNSPNAIPDESPSERVAAAPAVRVRQVERLRIDIGAAGRTGSSTWEIIVIEIHGSIAFPALQLYSSAIGQSRHCGATARSVLSGRASGEDRSDAT